MRLETGEGTAVAVVVFGEVALSNCDILDPTAIVEVVAFVVV
jgi:hypothetical protein